MPNVIITGNAPYRENNHNTSRTIRDAIPRLIKRPGHADIAIWKYHRDSLDTYKNILKMVEEIWNAKHSSFLPKAGPEDNEDDEVDITFVLYIRITTAVPEFRAKKVTYRDGYERAGEDRVYADKERFQKLRLPGSLEPGFDLDRAVASVKEQFPVCHRRRVFLGEPTSLRRRLSIGYPHPYVRGS
ncbi:MAG: hypothetical protein Q9222_000709 [Ikaeria aurantiellina]